MRQPLRSVSLLLFALTTVLSACGDNDVPVATDDVPTTTSTATTAPNDTMPDQEAAPFTLYVSNQSFEDSEVDITITIDGETVVDQGFEVQGQHNWITFEPSVASGPHTLHAVSNTGAEFTTEFTVAEGTAHWSVLDYWFYPAEGPRHFAFNIQDEPIGFA